MVLLAPATGWLKSAGACKRVRFITVLVQKRTIWHAARLDASFAMAEFPDQTRCNRELWRMTEHFSFLSPFAEPNASAEYALSKEPADRRKDFTMN